MKILMYCQHVLGIGHMVRTLAIANELAKENDITVLCGGTKPNDIKLNGNLKIVWLTPVQSTEDFSKYHSALNKEVDYSLLVNERITQIKKTAKKFNPDVLWVEGFPFARRKFKKEIFESISYVKRLNPKCMVCSSVRDVLLKYGADKEYRKYVAEELNRHFDKLFIHSDPKIIPLELTFGSLEEIKCEVIYTGFVCRIENHAVKSEKPLKTGSVVISCGGSSVGEKILKTAIDYQNTYSPDLQIHIFTNPIYEKRNGNLKLPIKKNTIIHSFTWDYINYLKTAFLSVSMGGYNSIIEAIASNTPGIVIPFNGNDEQRIRVNQLKDFHPFEIIEHDDLNAEGIHLAIANLSKHQSRRNGEINISGVKFIKNFFR